MRVRFLLVVLALLFSACAPKAQLPPIYANLTEQERERQMDMVVQNVDRQFGRLYTVAAPLLDANVDLCGEKVAPRIGLVPYNITNATEDWRGAWRRILVPTEKTQAWHIMPGSPAEQAGLQRGDIILAINGEQVRIGRKPIDRFNEQLNKATAPGTPITLTIERGMQRVDIDVAPRPQCDMPMFMVEHDAINAFTDGHTVAVFQGMMNFAESDDELAVVIGHEMAHAAQEHVERQRGNAMAGSLFDALIIVLTGMNTGLGQQVGMGVYSQDYENEADYVGLYFAARAGYDIDVAAPLWRRMATRYPGSITHASTHPTTAERFVRLEAAAKEIHHKAAAGQVLLFKSN